MPESVNDPKLWKVNGLPVVADVMTPEFATLYVEKLTACEDKVAELPTVIPNEVTPMVPEDAVTLALMT